MAARRDRARRCRAALGVSGWTWTVPALALCVAVVVALVARVVGVLLPREGRWIADRAGVLAALGALVFLLTQSSAWAVLLVAGLAGGALPLPQRPRIRRVALAAGIAVALLGAAGLVVQGIAVRADRVAAYQAAGDVARAQLLPDTPDDALIALMDAVARPDDAGCHLLTDAGRAALTAAYDAPDCPSALRAAGTGVDDPAEYARRVDRASVDVQLDPNGQRATVDGCHVRWRPSLDELLNGRQPGTPDPGLPLARITVVPLYGPAGWAIEDVTSCR